MKRLTLSWLVCSATLALLLLSWPALSRAAMGDLDTSFGPNGDGTVTTNFGFGYDYGKSAVIRSDGKILVAGSANTASDRDFALARYTSDGVLDTTFGTNGLVTTNFGSSYNYGESMAIQSDGKILVAGSVETGSDWDFALARYTSDGDLDASFGTNGLVLTDFDSGYDYGYSVAVQADGKILVGGHANNGSDWDFALARYDSDGDLDTSFGPDGNGKVTTDFDSDNDWGYCMVLKSDGKILLAGYVGDTFANFALARYDSDGDLDTTFANSGKVITPNFGNGYDRALSMAVQSDGKILLAGYTDGGVNEDFALARYDSDGNLDTTFGNSGSVTTHFGEGEDRGYSVAVQSDDKILVAGYAVVGSSEDFALVRYTDDGELDSNFGNSGTVTTNFGSGNDMAQSVTIQSDGKIVLAGFAADGPSRNFALTRYWAQSTPILATAAVSAITASSATSGGTVSDDGGESVTDRGVCWNTSGSPTTADTCTNDGTGAGSYTSSLSGLNADTTYYVRAYATNSLGTAYGDERSFTTSSTTPSVTTTTVSDITAESAASGGTVGSDGGAVTARGVCWDTSGSPTLDDTCTFNGTGTGSFSSNLIGLSAGTVYYVRAYAANTAGTAYGDEKSFTTKEGSSPGAPSVQTGTPEVITTSGATVPGTVTDQGSATVTARGVCHTMVNDTATLCVPCSSGGGGSFNVELTGLQPATRYTAFAYAVNSAGMGSGNVTTFTTQALYDHVLFFRNTQSGQSALMYFSGATRQGYALSAQAGQVWQARDVADFDHDNSPDAMWQNQESGQMVLVSMNNYLSGEIRGKGSYPEWSASVCGDFNGDGYEDVAWRNSESGQVVAQLFENLEPVGLQGVMVLSNLDWLLSTAGDFNADGTDDLVFRNLQNGRVGMALLENAIFASAAYLPDVTNQAFSVVAALDMDLDGSTDIIWHNATTGDLYVEYLSGLEHLHYGYLTHAPLEWIPFGGASYEK